MTQIHWFSFWFGIGAALGLMVIIALALFGLYVWGMRGFDYHG